MIPRLRTLSMRKMSKAAVAVVLTLIALDLVAGAAALAFGVRMFKR